MAPAREASSVSPHTVLIVSGGLGTSAEQVLNTVLAQFPDREVKILARPDVRDPDRVGPILDDAREIDATVVHTLLHPETHQALVEGARARGVYAIDLIGELVERLSAVLGAQPLGQPGRYRELRQDYFDRVAAIEFTMSKDDGLNPRDWPRADIVLMGLSRVGKTPLSMYLAVQGWKVANVPLIQDLPVPEGLQQVDRGRRFGLLLEHEELLKHRRHRQRELGHAGGSYANPRAVFEEIEWVRAQFKRLCVATFNVTGKPIETTAAEIIRRLQARFGDEARVSARS